MEVSGIQRACAVIRRKGALTWLSVILIVAVAALGISAPHIGLWVVHRRSHRCCEANAPKRCWQNFDWVDGRAECEVEGTCCCSFGRSHVSCGCGRSAFATSSGGLEIGPEPDNGRFDADPARK